MRIYLKKFGTTLTSRQAGREAYNAFQPVLQTAKQSEKIKIDFAGVVTFTPSWADEFLTPLKEKYKDKLVLINTENVSVQATLKLLNYA